MISPSNSPDNVASLYRRFRPGRFAEIKGQDHIVRALTGAVQNDRVSHAYLFSGPRGTGKTTTARILAKVLNCENPENGDACNQCESCVAITRGSSLDVLELDAASNNGVENIREIVSNAWHGTSGRRKVYIVDEVHMLSKSAQTAFLKTLEEPPAHVIFVLATTDPHKVESTIRSRCQHLEFRLFNADTLSTLLHEVRDAAGLTLDDATLASAVRMGHGSARDALSALDQVLATGSIGDATPPFDELLSALVANDAVSTLAALASLGRLGWDPEQLGAEFAGELRQIFLLLVAPEISDALDIDRERLMSWGQQLGLARTVRTLEAIGRTLREMKNSPVPIVMLEVALVRVTRPDLDDSIGALDERVTRLERSAVTHVVPGTMAPAPVPRPISSLTKAAAADRSSPAVVTAPEPEKSKKPEPVVSAGSTGSVLDLSFPEFLDRFTSLVLPKLSRTAQLLLGTSKLTSLSGAVLTIMVPSESMRESSDRIQSGLRSALEHEFGVTLQIAWKIDPTMDSSNERRGAAATMSEQLVNDDLMDDHDIATSERLDIDSLATMLITDAFPGAEEIR